MKPKGPRPKPEKQIKVAKLFQRFATPIKKKSAKDSELDKWFSVFIRLRDADENGLCRCIISGELIPWNECDAGHFISRREKSTKYHEQNVHAQGRGSNRFKGGEQYLYALAIDKKYGAGTSVKLHVLSKKTRKFEQFEIDAMTKHYRTFSRKIAKEKGIEI